LNPHAGNGGDVLKHLVLATTLDLTTPDLFVETHAGLAFNDLRLAGYKYPTGLFPAAVQPVTKKGRNRKNPPYAHDYLKATASTTHISPYRTVLTQNYPDPHGTRSRSCLLNDGSWYPGSVGIVRLIRPNTPRLLLREADLSAGPELSFLFPNSSTTMVAGSSLLPPDHFPLLLETALATLTPSSQALILVDPFHLAPSKSTFAAQSEDAVDCLRMVWRFATHPSRPVILAWYPIFFANNPAIPAPTPAGITDLMNALLASPRQLVPRGNNRPRLIEMRWGRVRGMCGAGVIAINPPSKLIVEVRKQLNVLTKSPVQGVSVNPNGIISFTIR